ncbi:BSD domain-containing protein 1-like [Triticum urartu]|nr:BSD domain-containing protein 1-like [Triticum urartu]XP_048547492.1 BSD domain-containing protein 1-like [Triticum urartu]XP_048563119.1 BSD domain-containing protein 1-like [Triticum urartu]
MDFLFNSLAAPDPASPPSEPEEAAAGSSSPAGSGDGGGWGGFGGLLKTLTSQSETVLDAYRRDLAEFSTGLRRETDALREAAAQAARDLPSSALALDGLADIVAQGKGAIAQVAATAAASAASLPAPSDADSEPSPASGHLRYYSRFEAQLRALQSDPATFTADPEDAEDFAAWGAGFSLQERQDEIEALCYESDAVEGMVDRLVPDTVEGEVFWARYFYRVHKLKQQEDARAKLVKRVIAQEEEEDLSWEVDDEVEEEEPAKEEAIKQAPIKEEPKPEVQERENEKLEAEGRVNAVEEAGALDKEQKNADLPQPEVFGSSMVVVDKEEEKEDASKLNVEESSDKKTAAEEPHSTAGDAAAKEGTKHETSDSSKDSDYSMVSRQRTATEEDLEWDEIEDLGEHEEKKGSAHGSSSAPKEELRKRLSVAEDDEDLSWDIEDDDDDKA